MRQLPVILLMLVACMLPTSSQAQGPSNILIAGASRAALGQGPGQAWCSVSAAASDFQRPSGGTAKISIGELLYTDMDPEGDFPELIYYGLSGQAQLVFTSSTAGDLLFDFPAEYPVSVRRPSFSGYSQTYSQFGRRVLVRFLISFEKCDVPFAAYYRH
jgi:hypothetical protein